MSEDSKPIDDLEAAAVLATGLRALRFWFSRQDPSSRPKDQVLASLLEDLHNHPAFLVGKCPADVIVRGHRSAMEILANARNPSFALYID